MSVCFSVHVWRGPFKKSPYSGTCCFCEEQIISDSLSNQLFTDFKRSIKNLKIRRGLLIFLWSNNLTIYLPFVCPLLTSPAILFISAAPYFSIWFKFGSFYIVFFSLALLIALLIFWCLLFSLPKVLA